MGDLRDDVIGLLGGSFGAERLAVSAREKRPTFRGRRIEDVQFRLQDGTPVSGTFVAPPDGTAPAPAVLYCHAHGGRYDIGRAELFDGRPALQSSYAGDLIALGVAVLCLDMPCFGARADLSEDATAKAYQWHGKTLFGQMLAELHAGVTWLTKQPGIDRLRIGTMGISMGGTHAWWLAALDPRILASANLCCFADMARLIETGAHDGHGNYMTVPGLLARTSTGDLAGLAAPRASLTCVGMADWSTPRGPFDTAWAAMQRAYAKAPDMLELHQDPDTGHEETPAMRARVLDFLHRRLCLGG